MAWLDSRLLTVLTFLPLAWGLAGLALPTGRDGKAIKTWTLLGSLATFWVSWVLLRRFDGATAATQFGEVMPWIPALGIHYRLGVDGLSLWLILLTTFLMPIVVLGSFTAVEERIKGFFFLLLALETGMIGAFVTLDAFLGQTNATAAAGMIISASETLKFGRNTTFRSPRTDAIFNLPETGFPWLDPDPSE